MTGLKELNKWPTYPQLIVNGEFVGGLDIIREMIDNGEFEEVVKGEWIMAERAEAFRRGEMTSWGRITSFRGSETDLVWTAPENTVENCL